MSACSICSKIDDPYMSSRHNAINLINKLNSLTDKQLKIVELPFIHDQILLTEMGFLDQHTRSEEEIFKEFGKRVKLIKNSVVDDLLKWIPQQWNVQTHVQFMNFLPKPKKRFLGIF